MKVFADYKNIDGTYDGAGVMAAISGISRDEVMWMWERMRTLRASGIDSEEAKDIIAREAPFKPWVKR